MQIDNQKHDYVRHPGTYFWRFGIIAKRSSQICLCPLARNANLKVQHEINVLCHQNPKSASGIGLFFICRNSMRSTNHLI